MKRYVLHATCLGELCRFEGIDIVIVVTGPNLYRQRNRDRFLNLFENRFQTRIVTEQPRTAAVLYHLGGGATAIDFQNIGSKLFSRFRRHPHSLRLATKNLD